MGALLERGFEVDQDVVAEDHVELVERTVADEVVAGPCDVSLELMLEPRAVAGDRVEVGDRTRAPRARVRTLVSAYPFERVCTRPSDGEALLVEVGCIYP